MSGLSRRVAIGLVTAGLAAAPASSDEILLKNGGRVNGVIVERTASAIVMETGPGRVTLSMARVEKVVEGRSALEAYHERIERLAPGDVGGWAAIARWAGERDMQTQSREAWQRVLAINPSDPEANAALGRVELDGAWMGEAEAYRARGYVSFEGRWITPAEHEALVRERATEEASEREAREASLRVREAEARAREAEARAREAEVGAQPADGGIPYGWGWGGGVLLPGSPGVDPHPRERGSRGHDGHASERPPHQQAQQPPHQQPTPKPEERPQPPRARTAGVDPPPARPMSRQD
jgi:hypothetical protein